MYFENTLIADAIKKGAHVDCEYFGVVSHKLAEKVNGGQQGPRMRAKQWHEPAFMDRLCSELVPQCDVFGFIQYLPHDPVRYFLAVHPTLPFYFREVTERVGAAWDMRGLNLRHVFYGNHFVARADVYEDYVTTMLAPAIKVMDEMPELMQDSGYPYKLPPDLAAKFGVPWYPLQTFICERLFSWYVHLHPGLIVKYY